MRQGSRRWLPWLAVVGLVTAAVWTPPQPADTSTIGTPSSQQQHFNLTLRPVSVDGQPVTPASLGILQSAADTSESFGLSPIEHAVLRGHDDSLPDSFQVDTQVRSYSSPTIEAPQQFNAVGFHWDAHLPEGADIAFEVRASQDSAVWGEWQGVGGIDALLGTSDVRDTELAFVGGKYVQYRIVVAGAPTDWSGVFDSVRITYIDSSRGPTADEAAGEGSFISRLAAIIRPSVISRNGWGANESWRFSGGSELLPREYFPIQKIIVHHTDSGNTPPDPAASIRAIYQYHAVTLGWGDIGYNFIIDANGRIYEGRFGGSGVKGAHSAKYNPGSIGVALLGTYTSTAPTAAMMQALENFVLTKSIQYGLDPNGRSMFIDKDIPNIVGHRDVMATACPGDLVQGMLTELRAKTMSSLPPLAVAWISDGTPKIVPPGEDVTVPLIAKNSGTAAWNPIGQGAVSVSYRWFKPDGTPYAGESLKTALPSTVNPKQGVNLQATLRAPTEEGRYLLRWDMQQATWFEENGSTPSEQWVLVSPYATAPNDFIVGLPNEILTLFPPERLRTLPLSRLTLFSNTDLVAMMPDIVQQFPNGRVLSFSNDMLLRYLPDSRLKTFSLDRLRTFPYYVQVRLGVAQAPSATPVGTAVIPPTSTPTPGFITSTATPTPFPSFSPTPSPTPFAGSGDPGGGAPP